MAGNEKVRYSITEYTAKAHTALDKLRKEQQPGMKELGNKTDILNAMKSEIQKLMDDGYTAKQIADAFTTDVFVILPKSITQIISAGNKKKVKRPARPAASEVPVNTKQERPSVQQSSREGKSDGLSEGASKQQPATPGTIKVKPDEDV